MKRVLCTLPLLLLLGACRQSEAPTAAAPAPAPASEPASSAAQPAPPASTASMPAATPAAKAPPAVDTGAMSGAFGAGSTQLELRGEGTYGLDEGGTVTSGTWTPAGTNEIRLIPGTKGAHERTYRRDGNDALVLVDAGGESPAGTRLKRLPMP